MLCFPTQSVKRILITRTSGQEGAQYLTKKERPVSAKYRIAFCPIHVVLTFLDANRG